MSDNQGRLLNFFDYIGDCIGFTRTGNSQQKLMRDIFFNISAEKIYCHRLVACGRIIRYEFEPVQNIFRFYIES